MMTVHIVADKCGWLRLFGGKVIRISGCVKDDDKGQMGWGAEWDIPILGLRLDF